MRHSGQDDDEELKDCASTYASSLFTVASNHSFEHGRRYFDASERMRRYWAPDDAKHQDTGELLHEVTRIVQKGKLINAPIENPERILDLGTATGLVALELSEMYPNATVTGTDINPIPLPVYSPQNVNFLVEDFTLPSWPFPENNFDYIHARYLYGSMSYDEWPQIYQKAFTYLKPGGWMESNELGVTAISDDGTVGPGVVMHDIGFYCNEASEKIGRPLMITENVKSWMEAAGFVDIRVIRRKLPVGRWPKSKTLKLAGEMMITVMSDGLEGFTSRLLTNRLGLSTEEAQAMWNTYMVQIRDRSLGLHPYYPMVVVYGRKPENA